MDVRTRIDGRLLIQSATRAALFGLTGLAFFAYWFAAKPNFEVSPVQGQWPSVLVFSAMILLLALAVPQFAQLVGGRAVVRSSLVVAAGAALCSAANIVEDGLKVEWFFYVFVAGTAIILVGLLALAITIAARPGRRYFALVPAGSLAGVLFYAIAGGPVLLATWLLAAAFVFAPTRSGA